MMNSNNFGSATYIRKKRKLPFYKKIWNILRGKRELNYSWELIGETWNGD